MQLLYHRWRIEHEKKYDSLLDCAKLFKNGMPTGDYEPYKGTAAT